MPLIVCNYIVNLEKLGSADEKTTKTVAQKPSEQVSDSLSSCAQFTHRTPK